MFVIFKATLYFVIFQVSLSVNGETWACPSKGGQVEVRVSADGFDSALSQMVRSCLPTTVFKSTANVTESGKNVTNNRHLINDNQNYYSVCFSQNSNYTIN